MKRNFTLCVGLCLCMFLPVLLFAQNNRYELMLSSGKIQPVQNVSGLQKTSDVFVKSLYLDKHYVTIQFNVLPDAAMKTQLAAAGIELIDYIPNMAYTAIVDKNIDPATFASLSIRSVIHFSENQKTLSTVLSAQVPAHAEKVSGFADVSILLYEYLNADKIRGALAGINTLILTDLPVFRMYTVRVPKENLARLAALPFVQWMEYIDPPNVPENLPGRSLHRVHILNDGVRNLKGDGMNIGVWDEVASQHLDFSPLGRMTNVEPGTPGSHGTHVNGTVGAKGLINPTARGMAPNANLYSYNGFNGDVQVEMATAIPQYELISSNHSYHDGLGVQCNLNGASASYSLRARNTDVNLNNNLYHLHVHSAGNAQTSCANGWMTITGTGKSAKNNLVVAAITSLESMTGYSSFGPVHDGRVKPEISAMGDNVFSTYTPLNTYASISGTSMATPGVTGTVALLAQRYKQLNANVLPPSSLIKNITLNTATDLGNVGPDYRFGYGRLNALAAVKILEENRYQVNNVMTGETKDVTIVVPPGAARLRVMLTWNDPAAVANVSFALVNNLDLRVIEGINTHLPWILNPVTPSVPAIQADDNISNIEQVTINNPTPGVYTLRVNGEAVAVGPNQVYALTWDIEQPYIDLIYPNGGESFNPGSTHVITWDNAGVTGTQTVEYSLDNGATWNLISNSVPATTSRLTWSVPSANTSTALVRVSSGTLSDVSNLHFKILNIPTGLSGSGVSCNAGEVIFNWGSVANATHYDIYRLDPVTGSFVTLATNLTGTSYTATGLVPNTSMWFTIRAKNSTVFSESERANAINVTVSNGGGGIGAVGTITGQTSICGAVNNVPYSIAPVTGATTYTWTVPTGAVIVSGAGSTSIMVNYPVGSSSGNVTVRAGNGSCETAPSTLAVMVGTEPASPLGGGNQSQTVCPGNPMPTLTASATVPGGHTLIWYNAASGGSIVPSPTLNTAGTITYYAASRNSTNGCESNTRTGVTLTIIAVPTATAVASGATTFCQGGNVVLTANSGSSYVWQKDGVTISGATSQAYTANSTGTYRVTVITGSCTSTSAAISVTVNDLPASNVTASGATTFCQGANVVLTASPGSSWSWSNGATTQSITVNSTGNYSVTVTNAAGCSAGSSATAVNVSPSPVVNISAAPYTNLFPGLSTNLTANVTPPGNYNYAWFKNGIAVPGATSATLQGIRLADIGNYTVTVTNAGSGLPCSNTSPAIAIGDSATTKLFIYPTPNDGKFSAVYYTPGQNIINTIVVFDSKGAQVYRRNYSISSPYQLMEIDMRRNGKGIYRVVLFDKTGKKLAHGSVVIQ